TRLSRDWSSDVCSSDLIPVAGALRPLRRRRGRARRDGGRRGDPGPAGRGPPAGAGPRRWGGVRVGRVGVVAVGVTAGAHRVGVGVPVVPAAAVVVDATARRWLP